MTFIKLCQLLSLFTKTIMLDFWLKSCQGKEKITIGLGLITILVMNRYHEGVAILSKTPIEAREILVSDVDDPEQTIILAVLPWLKL